MTIQKITTVSGAVYFYDADTNKITGGSFDLQDADLLISPEVGRSLYINAPERAKANPSASVPGVTSGYVVKIEDTREQKMR